MMSNGITRARAQPDQSEAVRTMYIQRAARPAPPTGTARRASEFDELPMTSPPVATAVGNTYEREAIAQRAKEEEVLAEKKATSSPLVI